MVTIVLELDQETERKARDAGLLTSEKIGELIAAEIERRRIKANLRLHQIMNDVSAHMRATYPDLTDEEAQSMIDVWIAEADADDSKPNG